MTTKSMMYDDPQYHVRQSFGGSISGSGGAIRFAAWTAMIVKSVQIAPTVAGTSNDTVTAYKYSGTTTTTQALTTYGSAGVTSTNVLSTFTLAQGDAITIVKGTDATGVMALGIEFQPVAGGVVTS